MKNIDFLPDIYRHRRTLRHTRLCWMGVGLLFALAIAGTASGQWYFRSALVAQLQVVEPQYALALTRQAEIAQLEAGKKSTEALAALYVYLGHPWPRTQLLAAIAEPMPSSMQLTDLQLLEQADATPVARGEGGDTNHSASEGEKVAKPTAKSVLAALRSEHDHQQTVLELSGLAASDQEVHGYVAALAKSPLFASVSLKGLESARQEKQEGSSFHIHVIVRPGYGQPGAPTLQPAAASVAVGEAATRSAASNSGGSP